MSRHGAARTVRQGESGLGDAERAVLGGSNVASYAAAVVALFSERLTTCAPQAKTL